jgi:hypothetical protein
MNSNLALRLLGEVMKWTDEEAHEEFKWIRLMSRFKYDGYGDYLAGVRFIESLARWLQQFAEQDERREAYRFVKERLIYISHTEMHRLVERFYPTVVRPELAREAARAADVREYQVWANDEARRRFKVLKRCSLFLGLSDGARIDVLRRANIGELGNEQIVVGAQLDTDKWRDLAKELREDKGMQHIGAAEIRFSRVYLLDDFTASGTTLLCKKKDGTWTGKLHRFWQSMQSARKELGESFPIVEHPLVRVHHYLATVNAMDAIRQRNTEAARERGENWFRDIEFSAGMDFNPTCTLDETRDAPFLALADKYYDPVLVNDHTRKSGVDHMRRGYAGCALPLILEHNTPNNSISLLWAETGGAGGHHAMRPLFRRRSRHV